ncbi:MAG: hypothetical protein V3R94_04680 [Acidobacteriota bacterium]
MRVVKVVILVVGVLAVIYGLVTRGLTVGNQVAAGGLLLFCLTSTSYFLVLPVSRDSEGKWRPNPDFAWLSIYLLVAAICVGWLYLLNR